MLSVFEAVSADVDAAAATSAVCVLRCRVPRRLQSRRWPRGGGDLLPPWTGPSCLAFFVACAWMAWAVFYMVLWSLWQPREVVVSLLAAWAATLALSLLVIEPAVKAAALVWALVLWPSLSPFVLWLPVLAPLLRDRSGGGGAGAAAVDAGARGHVSALLLSGRLQHLTLTRAAGYASSLSPDAAVVAFISNALLCSVLGGGALGRGSSEQAAREATEADSRGALVARRYLLLQLAAAEQRRLQLLEAAALRAAAAAAPCSSTRP